MHIARCLLGPEERQSEAGGILDLSLTGATHYQNPYMEFGTYSLGQNPDSPVVVDPSKLPHHPQGCVTFTGDHTSC
jgi:hypothetical protein